jgi:hypothetical protein
MQIPKNIKDSIKKTSYHSAIAYKHNQIVRDWFEKNYIDNDTVIDNFIDSCEMASNGADSFIQWFEQEYNKD